MILHPLNVLDGLIIVVMGWNILRGFNKGFVEELVSVIGIIVSLGFSFRLAKPLLSVFRMQRDSISLVVSGFIIFLLSFIFFKYIAFSLNSRLKDGFLGFLNNFLGFLFGVVRGWIIASFFVFLIAVIAPKSYLITKSYLGGFSIPLLDWSMNFMPEKDREKILPRWKTAKVHLERNKMSWFKSR